MNTEECCVYEIEHNVNNRIYIGITDNFNRRMSEHRSYPNKKMKPDMTVFDDSFTSKIIFRGTRNQCFTKEIDLIKELNPYYNTSPGGEGAGAGEDSPSTKLCNNDVLEIRERGYCGEPHSSIAKDYSISRKQIQRICTGERWGSVGGFIAGIDYIKHITNSLFDESTVIEIRERCANTLDRYEDIGDDYSTTKQNIGNISRGDTYKSFGGPITTNKKVATKHRRTGNKINKTQALEIKMRGYFTKDTYNSISENYPIGPDACSSIIRGKTWNDVVAPTLGKDYQKRGEGIVS